MEKQLEQLLDTAMDSYRAALVAMGKCGVQACPPLGEDLQQALWNLHQRLSSDASPLVLSETEQRVGQELQQFGKRASDYYKQKANDVREIMTIIARMAQAVTDRDQRYVNHFNELSEQLHAIADLEDLTNIRKSIGQQAIELKSSINRMAQDGQQTVAQLRSELSEYQSRLEEAEKLASVDTLTGLHNRLRVERQIQLRVEQAQPFCVIVFDLNGFKQINDLHGHLAGDEVLKQFATELRSFFRSTDAVGRWGGDEFMVVMDGGLNEAKSRIDKIREWVYGDYTFQVEGKSRQVSVSAAVGMAAWKLGETAKQVFGRADAAMYEQKSKLGESRR